MRWLIDDTLPAALVVELETLGHDAVAVAPHSEHASEQAVYAQAAADGRVVVTENFGDFLRLQADRARAGLPQSVTVLVRRADFPDNGRLAHVLARALVDWASANPEPYPGGHVL